MKKIIFLLLFFCFSVYGLADLQVNAKLDHQYAMKTDVLQITISNNGTVDSEETTAVFSWYCCENRTYHVPALAPGEYTTLTDTLIFPDADIYRLRIEVDPENNVLEDNSTLGNNVWEKEVAIILPRIDAEPEPEINLHDEPIVKISCVDTDLMKIGRVVDENGEYVREPDGRLSRDTTGDESVWLPGQEGNGCGSTSLAYILRYLGLGEYSQSDVDEKIRMSWGDGSFSDPFMIRDYAQEQGADARVYVDGSMEKIEWFIDHNIPVMIAISIDGSTDVTEGHWVVAVSHCLREKTDAPGTYERVIGIYNPWGHQQEISYERFERYWTRQDLGEIPLWNRAYVAIYTGSPPPGMPESNIDGWTNLKMNTAAGISQFLVAVQEFGDGFVEMFTGNFVVGLGKFIFGIGKAIVTLVIAVVEFITTLIIQIFSWIWQGIKAFFCWVAGWFGYDCDGTPHYYKHTLFSSHPCAEGAIYLNGFIMDQPLGYIYTEQKNGTIPIFQYAKIDENGSIVNYVVSDKGTLNESDGQLLEPLGVIGYAYPVVAPNTFELAPLLINKNMEVIGSAGYIKFYKGNDTKILWLFKDKNENGYLSRDQCAGTKSFPFALSGKEKPFFWVYTRQHIVGYIYQNEQKRSVPLFRFYDSKHQTFYPTTNLTEGIEKGYQYSGLVGYLNLPEPHIAGAMSHLEPTIGCREGERYIYRYKNKHTGDYTITMTTSMSPDYEDGTTLGCISTCPANCTTPLWIFTAQEIRKE